MKRKAGRKKKDVGLKAEMIWEGYFGRRDHRRKGAAY